MDKLLRAEINATVEKTIREVLEGAEEVWLKKEDFLKTFPMFTESWMKTYGKYVPREKANVVDKEGNGASTRYQYPKHKINRLITEGYFRNIVIE